MPPATWRIRSLVSASAVMAGVTGVVVGAIFLTSLYLQAVIGASPLVAGLEFLPLAAAITLSAAAASQVIGHLGARTLILGGLVVMAGGVLLLAANARRHVLRRRRAARLPAPRRRRRADVRGDRRRRDERRPGRAARVWPSG